MSSPRHVRRRLSIARVLTPVAISAVVVLMLFWPAVGHGRVLALGDGLIEAVPAFFSPNARWQPAMLLGFPIYADSSKAFWYPLRLLRYLPDGFNAYILLGYVIAAWSTYGYVRDVTGVAVAGISSAIAFTLGGFLIAHLGQPMIVQPAAWACVSIWSLHTFVHLAQSRWLVAMACAEALCLASGQPQIAAFTVIMLFGYLMWMAPEGRTLRSTSMAYIEGCLGIVLGIAIAATVWIPTIAQATVSVRSGLDFRAFVADSIPVEHLARLLVYPFAAGGGSATIYGSPVVPAELGAFTEASCYVGVGTLAFALLAPFAGRRRVALFWFVVSCIGFILAAGAALPFAAWTYVLPGFNLFRLPGRHAFEFTLALSILSGLGVSAVAQKTDSRRLLISAAAGVAALVAAATRDVASVTPMFASQPAITIFALSAFAQVIGLLTIGLLPKRLAIRVPFACAVIVVGIWPFAEGAYWRDAPSARIVAKPTYVRFLEKLPLEPGQRIYAASDGDMKELDANLPIIWGVPELAGYTPLQFSSVHTMLQTGANGRLLDITSPMVDLAATRYFAVPAPHIGTLPSISPFAPTDLGLFLSAGRAEAPSEVSFGLPQPRCADEITLVTALGSSVKAVQGDVIAIVTVRDKNFRQQTFPLRAGIETAELAYDRPDVLSSIRHRRAQVYEHNASLSWYRSTTALHLAAGITFVKVTMVDNHVALNVRKIALIDTDTRRAYPFSREAPYLADARRFKHIADVGGVAIFENLKSMPAAWLARGLSRSINTTNDADLVLLREKLRGVDYRRTAFIDASSPERLARGNVTILRDEPERRDLLAVCANRCLVVSSMTFTPDWTATIDGFDARVIRVDAILQGVQTDAGRHLIRLEYHPRAEKLGVVISICSTIALLGFVLLRRRVRLAR